MMWAGARRYRSDPVLREASKMLAVGLIALSTSACSLVVGVVGLEEEEPQTTGSLPSSTGQVLSPDLNEEDWRRAKAALGVALDPQGPGTQVSWDNPASSRKGSFTPTGAPFVKDDQICRAFSSSLSGATSASLHGTACRPSGGDWVIRNVQPAKIQAKA
jgi:surface antigen